MVVSRTTDNPRLCRLGRFMRGSSQLAIVLPAILLGRGCSGAPSRNHAMSGATCSNAVQATLIAQPPSRLLLDGGSESFTRRFDEPSSIASPGAAVTSRRRCQTRARLRSGGVPSRSDEANRCESPHAPASDARGSSISRATVVASREIGDSGARPRRMRTERSSRIGSGTTASRTAGGVATSRNSGRTRVPAARGPGRAG